MPADISQYTVQMVELSWRRVLAIAQNQADEGDPAGDMPASRDQRASPDGSPSPNAFYDRERRMIHALDSLFSLACEGHGYVAFISTIVSTLDHESPVAMAFLSHIIDRTALPSKTTMIQVSSTILAKLEDVRRQPLHQSQSQSGKGHGGDVSGHGGVFGFLQKISLDVPRKSFQSMRSASVGRKSLQHTNAAKVKINACVVWSLLSEKFAGDICFALWSDEVCDTLISMLADSNEDIMARIFALLALEKFSLTGGIKDKVVEHPRSIQATLLEIIKECEAAPVSCQEEFATEDPFWVTPPSPLLTIQSPKSRWARVTHRVQDMLQPLFARRKKGSLSFLASHTEQASGSELWPDENSTKTATVAKVEASRPSSVSSSLSSLSRASVGSHSIKERSIPTEFSSLNCFDTGYLPPEGTLRDNWTKYVQLAHCARWAYDNIFGDDKQITCSWSMASLNVVMNPFDATPYWKVGSSGLELRNDRPHFESMRATACVKSGKWYYETLLLSDGIMQVGWATSRCRFVPEDGYGVGDDCNGFAFDTYRSAVWADGSAVYPQSRSRIRCRAGDVLGSFLDLDNGLCSFFINGCDLGLTVEFEHPARQMHALNLQRIAQEREAASAATAATTAATQETTALTTATDATRTSEAAVDTSVDLNDPLSPPGSVVGLGLYPAVSLTTHQHILLNFGDRPWLYPPPVSAKYKGISEASKLDNGFKRRVSRALDKRWGSMMARQLYRPASPGRCQASLSSVDLQSETSDYDWDGPMCTICFSEPKNTILMPCHHGGLGEKCAKVLDMCPLCRASIHDRVIQPVTPPSS